MEQYHVQYSVVLKLDWCSMGMQKRRQASEELGFGIGSVVHSLMEMLEQCIAHRETEELAGPRRPGLCGGAISACKHTGGN